tara:strand:- start:1433 stop:1639 length:207 start_codon:yes stop_codon:yes gene_type:complete
MADEPTREQLIEQLQQEQGARLNQIASADPVINRIAGKLEILQALNAEEPELKVVESEAEEDASGTLG